MLRAIETGYVQGEIQKAAYEYQRAIERGEQIVVGVNQFVAEQERPSPLSASTPKSSKPKSPACSCSAPNATTPRSNPP